MSALTESVLADGRWRGAHGIGRFASEVLAQCGMRAACIGGSPVDPWDPLRLSQFLAAIKPAHFFSPGYNPPLGRPCPFSFTLHDLIHLETPEERSPAKWAYYRWIVRPAIGKASVIFTSSEHARQSIAGWANIDPARIILAGNGVSADFNPEGAVWRHERPYLLYVGNQKPHKNVEGLVEAFAASGLDRDFDVLLTGGLSPAMVRTLGRTGMKDRFRPLGLVPESVLPALYRGARALVMPSRHEGFGLPVIEAMACGTPVLSSNRTALPEVGADAVSYFDPDDQESFVTGLRALRDDVRLAELRERGLRRAGMFQWDTVATRVRTAIAESMRLDLAAGSESST